MYTYRWNLFQHIGSLSTFDGRVWKEELYASLTAIKHRFPFHYLDATCNKGEMVRRIKAELAYRPEAELTRDTLAITRDIETAASITKAARQALVARMNSYAVENRQLFKAAAQIVVRDLMHIIRRQGVMGVAIIRSENQALDNPLMLNMVLDILGEHGFTVALDVVKREVPVSMAPNPAAPGSFLIQCRVEKAFVFKVTFEATDLLGHHSPY